MPYHPGAHRIQFDITAAHHHILVATDEGALIECVPPFTRGVIGHEIGLVLARELRPLVPGHPLPLSSPQRLQWHVGGGRRGQDGCDRADTVCVSCHGDIPGRLCRLIDRKWYDDYPV